MDNDVLVLGQALLNYSDIIFKESGFHILGDNNILSNSSIASKDYFYNSYNEKECPIYQLPDEFFPAVSQAYHGGSCSAFRIGHIKDAYIFAIDINSSYPGQMLKEFPTGPYYKLDCANVRYEGQSLPMGVYQIFVKDSPYTKYPVFFTKSDDGISQPSIVRNKIMWKTSADIEYAYECGYDQIYLIQGIVSKNVTQPFVDYITT
jgi:hypothetical protein